MATTELELIETLVGSYSGMNSTDSVSSWIIYNDDLSEIQTELRQVCFAGMKRHKGRVYDNLLLAVPKHEEADLSVLSCLINGPFRKYADMITLITDEDGNHYIKITKLDMWPANVLYNFCIATRIPIEHSGVRDDYWTLVCAGVPETLALLVSLFQFYESIDPWDWTFKANCPKVYGGHYYLDPTSDWELVLKGEHFKNEVSGDTYKDNPSSSLPTNQIWGKSDKTRKLDGLTVRAIFNKFKDLIE